MSSESQTPILSLRNIKKSYGPIEVLHGIDLDVCAGEAVALLGENGAGKSTVSNVISGTVLPSSGDMTWQGAAYAPATPREALDRGVGMIHQELLLLPHLSIAENIFVGRYPTKAGVVDRRTMEERAEQGLQRLGLDISPSRLVAGLSTANQQLIEIAKALTLNARLLILDEPTAGVDIEMRRSMYDFLRETNDEGRTIILTTHYLEEAEMLCRNVGIINQGKIVTDGAIRDLLRDLNSETFLLDTQEELPSGISIPGYQIRQVEPQCLEVEIEKGQELAKVFTALGELGVSVVSMRNKENRLERMFVNVLEGAS